MMKYIAVSILVIASLCASAQPVANFSATDVVSGKSVSLSDFKSGPGVVVVFTSEGTSCPYDQHYLSRLQKLVRDFSSKIPVIFVNAHLPEAQVAASMKATASKLGAPYLADTEQAIMQSLKAAKSPEAFVLKNSGGNFSVFYHGAIDDNAQVESDVHENYLTDAINALLSGQAVKTPTVRPLGCTIRKK
jgi:thiol-disulfide isomerase/thioredoxin